MSAPPRSTAQAERIFPAAASLFEDPYWKGIAAYKAADFDLALASFAALLREWGRGLLAA